MRTERVGAQVTQQAGLGLCTAHPKSFEAGIVTVQCALPNAVLCTHLHTQLCTAAFGCAPSLAVGCVAGQRPIGAGHLCA